MSLILGTRLKEQLLSVESILFNGVGYPFLNGRNIQCLLSLYLELGHCHFYPFSIVRSKLHGQWMEQGIYFHLREAGEKAMR